MILKKDIFPAEELFANLGFSTLFISKSGKVSVEKSKEIPFKGNSGMTMEDLFAPESVEILRKFLDPKFDVAKDKIKLPLNIFPKNFGFQAIECFIAHGLEDPGQELLLFWRYTNLYDPSNLLSNFSYSIRTPMNGVIGMAGLLVESGLPKTQRHYAEIVLSSGEEMLALFDKLIDFNRIQSGTFQLKPADCDLEDVLDGFLKSQARKFQQKDLGFSLYISSDLPKFMEMDSSVFIRVLSLLLENAIEFTTHGSVELSLEKGPGKSGETLLILNVSDTGCGMDARLVGQIMKGDLPIAQDKQSTSFGGLGLAIACAFIRKMGGDYEVQSAPKKGTTFKVNFPIKFVGQEKLSKKITNSKPKAAVLVSDKKPLQYLSEVLTQSGFQVAPFTHSADFLKKLTHGDEKFDLAVVEHEGKDHHGIQVGQELVSQLESLPFLILWSDKLDEGNQETVSAGYQTVLRKASMPSVIQGQLEDFLEYQNKTHSEIPSMAQGPLLIVEDTPLNQEILSSQLTKLGHSCEIVESGEKALKLLEERAFSLILMDCQMPEMDGFEVTRRIREKEAGKDRMPIIAATAFALAGDREKCLAAGMDDYLSKPIKLDDLKRVLKKWLPEVPAFTKQKKVSSSDGEVNVLKEIDFSRLRAASGGSEEGLNQVRNLFFKNSRDFTGKLKKISNQKDRQIAVRATHDLKGACQLCGFMKLGELAGQLEKDCTKEEWESFHSNLARICERLESTEKVLQELKISDIQ